MLMMAFVIIDVAACQLYQCSVKDRFPRFLYALDIFCCDYKTSAFFCLTAAVADTSVQVVIRTNRDACATARTNWLI
jgi:hypothetical protein